MRLFLLTAMQLLCIVGNAANYYFSSSAGNDSRSVQEAQNPGTPWRSIQKLNAIFPTLSPGDTVFLKRGDVFEGKLIVSKSGSLNNDIVITAYGTGNKPVISGFSTLRNFQHHSGSIWTHSMATGMPSVLLVNEEQQPLGRFPNSNDAGGGYRFYNSFNGTTSITDNNLESGVNWAGGDLVIRKNRWIIDRCPITEQVGQELKFTNTSQYQLNKNFGYFIQNHVKALDRDGEWAFDRSKNRLYLFKNNFSAASTNVKVSVTDVLAEIHKQQHITLKDLVFTGANETALNITYANFISLIGCDVTYTGLNGIFLNYANDIKIESSLFQNSNNNAVTTRFGCSNITIRNNAFKNTGIYPGMGKDGDLGYQALTIKGKNNLIAYNTIDNTGYVPIRFEGDFVTIQNNFITNFCFVKDDGAGIYTWNNDANAPENTSRVVKNNIILNGIGAGAGTSYPHQRNAQGIYLDDNAANVEIFGNTVANCGEGGVYLHNARKSRVHDNTFFNNERQVYMQHDNVSPNNPIRDIELKNNILFSKKPTQQIMHIRSIKDDIGLFGTSDNNYLSRPFGSEPFTFTAYRKDFNEFIQAYDMASWQGAFQKDLSSKSAPLQIPFYQNKGTVGGNKIINSTFDKDVFNIYGYFAAGSYKLEWNNSNKLDGGSMQVTFDPTTNNRGLVIMNVGNVTAGKAYVLKYSLLGTSNNKSISMFLRKTGAPYTKITDVSYSVVKNSRTENEVYLVPNSTETAASLVFDISDQGTLWIDNLTLHEVNVTTVNPDDYVRFEYNASNQQKTIALDGSYIDVKGNTYSSTVSLAPYTSIVLMRTKGVEKATQTVSFPAIENKTYGDDRFELKATASSGLPVTYRVVSGPATVNGAVVTITGAGEVTIEAVQAGNDAFLPAPAVAQSFTVAKKAQNISFGTLSNKTIGDSPFPLTATSSSGLPVTYRVTSGPASISGGVVTLNGTGEVVIEASQTGDANHKAAAVVIRNFYVAEKQTTQTAQSLQFDPIKDQQFGTGPFVLTATASSGLPVSYRVVSGPAEVNGSTVTLKGAGVVVIEAIQEGNDAFMAAQPQTQTFRVAKASQSISFGALSGKVADDAPFAIQASASSGLPVRFAVISGPATITGSLVTLTGTGTVVIEATQPGNDNYNAASPVRQSFTVAASSAAKQGQTISFETLAYKTYTSPAFTLSATASSGLPVSYRVVSGPVTISGNVVTITGVGNVTIEAIQEGNAAFEAATPVTRSFTIGKASQLITFSEISNKSVSDAPFTLDATATSGLPVTYRVISGPAKVNGNVVTLTGTGTVTIEAVQNGNENYAASFPLYRTFTVTGGEIRQNQTIYFPFIRNINFGDEPFELTATASSGLPVTYRVISGPATLNDNVVTATAVGTVVIEASQSGNAAFAPATPQTRTFRIGKAEQTLTFETLPYQVYTSPAFTLSATASSGLPVSYRVVSGPVTISGNVVTITGVGNVIVEASQDGNKNYNAALPVQRGFTVGKAAQYIDFPLLSNKTHGDQPFALTATSTSGLPISYRVVSGPASVSGNIVTLTGVGTVTIEATQPGDDYFTPAFALQRSFDVLSASNGLVTSELMTPRTGGMESLPQAVAKNSISIWPNPVTSNGIIRITVAAAAKGDVEIYDAAGRIVKRFGNRRFEVGQTVQIDLNASGLPAGSYFIRVALKNKILTQRFQVVR